LAANLSAAPAPPAAPLAYAAADQTSATTNFDRAGSDPAPPAAAPQRSGQAIAFNQDGVTVNGAATPAVKGSAVSIYLAGEGAATPTRDAASITHTDRSAKKPVATVSATVGGLPAVVEYVGPSPGMAAAIGRVNVWIPSNAPSGNSIPVVITLGSGNTQAGVNLAIQ
jgi:uncharacterized protein (TIGR03437 family)